MTYVMVFTVVTDIGSILEPFILRRTKADVLKDLPKKSEVILYHGITSLQKKYYKAVLQKDYGKLNFYKTLTHSDGFIFKAYC